MKANFTLNGYGITVEKIDCTHLFWSSELCPDSRPWPYHIGELRGRAFFNDLREWLCGQAEVNGNVYTD